MATHTITPSATQTTVTRFDKAVMARQLREEQPSDSLYLLARTRILAGKPEFDNVEIGPAFVARENELWADVIEDFAGLLGKPLTAEGLHLIVSSAMSAVQEAEWGPWLGEKVDA